MGKPLTAGGSAVGGFFEWKVERGKWGGRYGLPRQCAHWLAMTFSKRAVRVGRRGEGTPPYGCTTECAVLIGRQKNANRWRLPLVRVSETNFPFSIFRFQLFYFPRRFLAKASFFRWGILHFCPDASGRLWRKLPPLGRSGFLGGSSGFLPKYFSPFCGRMRHFSS